LFSYDIDHRRNDLRIGSCNRDFVTSASPPILGRGWRWAGGYQGSSTTLDDGRFAGQPPRFKQGRHASFHQRSAMAGHGNGRGAPIEALRLIGEAADKTEGFAVGYDLFSMNHPMPGHGSRSGGRRASGCRCMCATLARGAGASSPWLRDRNARWRSGFDPNGRARALARHRRAGLCDRRDEPSGRVAHGHSEQRRRKSGSGHQFGFSGTAISFIQQR